MPDGFQIMGAQPQGYGGLVNGVVKGPNGTLIPFPQMSGSTSLQDIYGFTGFAPAGPGPSSPVGPGADWGALTGMVDDPIYSGGSTPSTYGQPPTTVAQTRAEQNAALKALQDLVGKNSGDVIQHIEAYGNAGPTQPYIDASNPIDIKRLGLTTGGRGGGATRVADAGATLTSPFGGIGAAGAGRTTFPLFDGTLAGASGRRFLDGDPGQTDWSVANNGMQGINGPVNAKYLPNDPRNKNPNAKPLPKYAVNNAPGTFNRETGTWNTGMPSSGGGLPNILGGLGGGGISMLGRLFGGGNDTRQTLLQHILSGITGMGQQQGAQTLASMVPGIGDVLAQHPLNIPQSGQLIATNNNGNQVIGDHLNGSPRGMTVTNDPWFNQVRGL